MLELRAAAPDDATAIAALHVASWRSAYRGILPDAYLDGPAAPELAAQWRQRCSAPRPNQHLRLAWDDGALVGFACSFGAADARWGTLPDNLHVTPARRGGGIGTRLVLEVADWCVAQHPGVPLHLWVLEDNAPAIGFYRSLGGVLADRTQWTAPDGTVVDDLRCAWDDVPALVRRLRERGGR